MSQMTSEQLEQLLQFAAARLGTTSEHLKTALKQQNLQGIPSLSEKQVSKAREVMGDKEKLAALLQDPSVRSLIGQLLD